MGVMSLSPPVCAGRRACRTRCRQASARTCRWGRRSLRAAPITMSGADPSADQHRRSSMDARPGRVQLPMLQPLRRPSIIDQAELELRTAIYDGSLRPGDAVPEVAVSRQLGISRSSLREACQRLVRDGLLTQHPGRGLFVTRMDAATMSDFIDYRLGIEMQAATIVARSEEHTSQLQSRGHLVCRLLRDAKNRNGK